jgi:ferredoxin-type protein NapF
MSSAINRMQFLRGDLSGRGVPCRPPWSIAEQDFVERCESCGDCVKACSPGILRQGRGGYPEVSFEQAGCSLCGDCLTACHGRALQGTAGDTAAAWPHRAEIGNGCLSVQGVICRACGEACDTCAIRFRLELGGIARPKIDADRCNGCGACSAACPVRAIRLTRAAALQAAV